MNPYTHSTHTYDSVRSTFLEFYLSRSHSRVQGTSLLPPPGDVLFTTSGMHPLTPYLEGSPHPQGRRLVNLQRCLRTTDLDEVGDSTHLTVFQMLGSWSLGDYSSQSLSWGYELLTEGFGLSPSSLYTTVFSGGEVPLDSLSLQVWEGLGLPVELLEENWWSNGPLGLCGPDSEIFVWTGSTPPEGTPSSDSRWVEVWNHVFMHFLRTSSGLTPLPQQNVDTGMGLERLLMVLQGHSSVYDTDVFSPWSFLPWTLPDQHLVWDHLRSSLVVLSDGVTPSNTQRGYVLRRLLRRTLTSLWSVDPEITLSDLPLSLVEHTLDVFEQVGDPSLLLSSLVQEEERFRSLIRRGRPLVERTLRRGPLTKEDYLFLHDTHGLPRELVDHLLTS